MARTEGRIALQGRQNLSRGRKKPCKKVTIGNMANLLLEDLKYTHLSTKAAAERMLCKRPRFLEFTSEELSRYCAPIKAEYQSRFQGADSTVSLIIPAYNEEVELLPTLLSVTCLDIDPGVLEVIVSDNNSCDRTAEIAIACGARFILEERKGVGYARLAGYKAMAPSSKYVWFTDADTRLVAPAAAASDFDSKSLLLRHILDFLEHHPDYIGISSGIVYEKTHWLHRIIRRLMVSAGKAKKMSCWAGANQFIRRKSLEESGGINPRIIYREDHARLFQLCRYAKKLGLHIADANNSPELGFPTYSSGRRYGTFLKTIKHRLREMQRAPIAERDEYGYPVHRESEAFDDIRS